MAKIRNCDWNLQAGRSTLLSVIGEEAVKAFDTFAWAESQSENKITDVLAKFDEYCEPHSSNLRTIPF